MTAIKRHPASFRDPSGFIYEKDGVLYRYISQSYRQNYESLKNSGLLDDLKKSNCMLPFVEVNENHFADKDWYLTLQPQKIPFLNYAFEWSFEQLKDAALTTLRICKKSLEKNIILKDATHFNVQFVDGLPVLIDTLSFEIYEEGNQWMAYRQFCECFLNPLLLASKCSIEVHQLLKACPDGVTAALTTQLLPAITKFNPIIYLHVYLNASVVKKPTPKTKQPSALSKKGLLRIIDSLYTLIQQLTFTKKQPIWNHYYTEQILSEDYLTEKKEIIQTWLKETDYSCVCDFGANDGAFSKLLQKDSFTVAVDADSTCIDGLYLHTKKNKIKHILPLVIDLTNPTPATGWNNQEHNAFLDRCNFDLGLALALVHHLAIGKNIPLNHIAELFANHCRQLIIEFVSKEDTKIQQMLENRNDIFTYYSKEYFESAFETYFSIEKKKQISNTYRTLYYMKRKV